MTFEDVKKIVSNIKLMSGKESFTTEEEVIKTNVDALTSFVSSPAHRDDLVSSGIDAEDYSYICNSKNSMKERWLHFKKYYDKIYDTSASKVLKIGLRDVYGVEEFNAESFEKLNRKMKEVRKKGFYDLVLRDMAKIEYIINDTHPHYSKMGFGWTWSNSYIFPLIMLGDFVLIWNKADIERIGQWTSVKISSFKDLLSAITEYIKKINSKIYGIKFTIAYYRTYKFECPSFDDAEKSFTEVMKIESKSKPEGRIEGHDIYIKGLLSGDSGDLLNKKSEAKPLQDFVMNHILYLAGEYNIPILFHTGFLGGYGEHYLDYANPTHLNELFIRHKNVKFVNLHGSFPFSNEVASLAKMFPNVYVDMSGYWVYVSPSEARLLLHRLIDFLPTNKVLVFGADEAMVEVTYATSVIARNTVSRVLWEKADSGDLSNERVSFIAKRWLRDNAYDVYLSGKKIKNK